jgi:hypothetical protein
MPLLNITDSPIGLSVQQQNVAAIIENALEVRGWQVVARRPGAFDASILVRTHRAGITISYDADSYSIVYRDSENLNYGMGGSSGTTTVGSPISTAIFSARWGRWFRTFRVAPL